MKCPPCIARDEYIIICRDARRVHCQTAAAGLVYTTILTAAVPAIQWSVCVRVCLYMTRTYGKRAACLCVCLRCRASRRQKLRSQQWYRRVNSHRRSSKAQCNTRFIIYIALALCDALFPHPLPSRRSWEVKRMILRISAVMRAVTRNVIHSRFLASSSLALFNLFDSTTRS